MSKINPYGLTSKQYARLYSVWQHMLNRCENPNDPSYINYGRRGVTACKEWRFDVHCFASWAVSNGYKQGLTIERKDVNGNYCPENCTFATRKEQNRNKTDTAWITICGETKPLSEWCEILHFNQSTAITRRNRGVLDPNMLFFDGNLRDYKRKIAQYTRNGELIALYPKVRIAERETGVSLSNIHNVCQGRSSTAGGYIWKYQYE